MPRVLAGSVVLETWRLTVRELVALLKSVDDQSRVGVTTRPGVILARLGERVVDVAIPPFAIVISGVDPATLPETLSKTPVAYVTARDTWLDLKWVSTRTLLAVAEALQECVLENNCGGISLDQNIEIRLGVVEEGCQEVYATGFYTAPYHYAGVKPGQPYTGEPGLVSEPGGVRLLEVSVGEKRVVNLKIPSKCRENAMLYFLSLLDVILYLADR
ncbi:hypothetical protein [Thermogladius calderae]|uniref:hypothetical protein n=1 Tax=Thermogladius calderae TaxID=1200300 RepID=UPI00064F7C55|nr:hypothetical protein [Thermogladius calderae]